MLLWLWLFYGLGENDPDALQERVRRLEQQLGAKVVTGAQMDLHKAQCSLLLDKERTSQGKLWNDLDTRIKEVDGKVKVLEGLRDHVWLITLSLLGVTIGFIIFGLFRLGKQVERTLMDQFQVKIDSLAKMVETHDLDQQIRKTERLLVLGRSSRMTQMVQMVKELGFRHVLEEPVPEGPPSVTLLAQLVQQGFDLVIFDELEEAWINAYLEERPEKVFLAYHRGSTLLKVDQNRVSFANSPMTLLARLMEAARYRRRLAA